MNVNTPWCSSSSEIFAEKIAKRMTRFERTGETCHWKGKAAVLSGFLSCFLIGGCASECTTLPSLGLPDSAPPSYHHQIAFSGRPLAVLGDTQRTSWRECLFLDRSVNDKEQARIVASIATKNPGLLVLAGDMVFQASSEINWRFFDHLILPLARSQIPLLAVLGNHEYYGDDREARALLNQRFPHLRTSDYYAERYGRLGLVFLNSNLDRLSNDQRRTQADWYQAQLDTFDCNPEIDGVLVFLHHPPYTNSTGAARDQDLGRPFVPAFTASAKGLAMISGHAHGYECFRKQGHLFITSAGGGGPLQRRRGAPEYCQEGRETLLEDNLYFNYLLIHQNDRGIRIEVHGLTTDDESVNLLDTLAIGFSTGRQDCPAELEE